MTIELEDKGQDFIEMDILENGVLLGYSSIFSYGRLTLLGIGTSDGMEYKTRDEVIEIGIRGLNKIIGTLSIFPTADDKFVYFKETDKSDPLPWKANTLKYRVLRAKEAKDARRFIKK